LDEAKIIVPNAKKQNLYYVLVTTNDGKTIFSWNELYSGTTRDKTIIIFEVNGKPVR